MRFAVFLISVLIFAGAVQTAEAGCVLVRTATTTPGCYGYVEYANGVRVGWFKRAGTWVRAGSIAKCIYGGIELRPMPFDCPTAPG